MWGKRRKFQQKSKKSIYIILLDLEKLSLRIPIKEKVDWK